jgi:tetratricopeptide (TPR) repeat protein
LAPWAIGNSFAYDNPYYDSSLYAPAGATDYVAPQALDYSEPLAVPTETEADQTDQETIDDAMSHANQARSYFKKGSYAKANEEVEQAIGLLPGDRTLHEFRALCLFALNRYDAAAGVLYAVLAAGPGMDWDSLAALYGDTNTYTEQLRRLADYVGKHPENAAAHFLLGYHYLVLDERDAALGEFRAASKLKPDDQLSAQLADALAQAPREEEP